MHLKLTGFRGNTKAKTEEFHVAFKKADISVISSCHGSNYMAMCPGILLASSYQFSSIDVALSAHSSNAFSSVKTQVDLITVRYDT